MCCCYISVAQIESFAADFGQFQKITGEQIQMLDELAKDVEREKKKASSESGAGAFVGVFVKILLRSWQ